MTTTKKRLNSFLKRKCIEFENNHSSQKDIGVKYIEMAINGLGLCRKDKKTRKSGGLSRAAYLREFKAFCNINLHICRCLFGVSFHGCSEFSEG